MDAVIVVYPEEKRAETKVMRKIKKGDFVVVGHNGIRVIPPEKSREAGQLFEFMNSEVSSEKPKEAIIRRIAKEMYEIREEYKKTGKGGIAIVGGPAIIHTGGGVITSYSIHYTKLYDTGTSPMSCGSSRSWECLPWE